MKTQFYSKTTEHWLVRDEETDFIEVFDEKQKGIKVKNPRIKQKPHPAITKEMYLEAEKAAITVHNQNLSKYDNK